MLKNENEISLEKLEPEESSKGAAGGGGEAGSLAGGVALQSEQKTNVVQLTKKFKD